MIDAAGYGRALYELSAEQGIEKTLGQQLEAVCGALKQEPRYITLMDTPAVGSSEKCAMM